MAMLESLATKTMDNRGGGTTRRLLERIREGDADARNALCQRYLDPLRRWARGRLPAGARDLLDTDDVVQETLIRSLRRVEAFQHRRKGAFESYLRRGVLNRIRDEVRRIPRKPMAVGTGSGVADPGPSPIELALGREKLETYERALQALSPRDRETILARIELDLSYDEIASLLGKRSADAARMAVSRAILRLAHALKEPG
jgi:RNA polymerase sigma-70 factor (ECF subfamily)